jgi:hypothetical protein
MLLFIGILVILAAVVTIPSVRMPRRNAASLGSMSEQWLAEYRASHPS